MLHPNAWLRMCAALVVLPVALCTGCTPPKPTPKPSHTYPDYTPLPTQPLSSTPIVPLVPGGLNGLSAGSYSCRTDEGSFKSDLEITSSAKYTGTEFGTNEAPISYDPGTGVVTFVSGDYFTGPGVPLPQHFIGKYPSTYAADPSGTILLSELPGYPGDSDNRPATQGSTSGLWHCALTSGSAPSVPPPTTPAVSTTPASNFAMSVPFGVYGVSSHSQEMRMRSDGTYSFGPIGNPDSGTPGTYRVISATSIEFVTGSYEGCPATLYPNYKGSTRSYIDVLYKGQTTSWQYNRP